jgi:hypothetical protein
VGLMEAQGGPMEKLIAKLDPEDVRMLFELTRMSKGAEVSTHSQPVKLDLPPMDLKFDGLATYLSCSRRFKSALAGRNLEGFLMGEAESRHCLVERVEDHTHIVVYIVSQLYGTIDCGHGG